MSEFRLTEADLGILGQKNDEVAIWTKCCHHNQGTQLGLVENLLKLETFNAMEIIVNQRTFHVRRPHECVCVKRIPSYYQKAHPPSSRIFSFREEEETDYIYTFFLTPSLTSATHLVY